MDYSPWVTKESDMTKHPHIHCYNDDDDDDVQNQTLIFPTEDVASNFSLMVSQ